MPKQARLLDKKGLRRRLLETIRSKTGKDLGKGWTIFARECGIGVSTMQAYLDPEDPAHPSADNLLKISKVGGVSPEYLLYGSVEERHPGSFGLKRATPKKLRDLIPVFEYAGAPLSFGVGGQPLGTPVFHIGRSLDNTDPNAYALRISGNHLAPRFWDGDIIEANTQPVVRTGQVAVVQHQDKRTWVATVTFQHRAGRVLVEGWAPGSLPVEFALADVRVLHRVVNVRYRGMY